MSKVAKEVPLTEMTLRKYEPPKADDTREIAKKICLSLGLLMPGDFRDIIVDIFLVVVQSQTPLTARQIEQEVIVLRKEYNLTLHGTASSNIRRQLRRLKQVYLIENVQGTYRLTENLSLTEIWLQKTYPIIVASTLDRIQAYLTTLDTLSKE